MDPKTGQGHLERKRLFTKGFREGYLDVEEVERALPPEALTDLERRLFYYCLRALGIEVRGGRGEGIPSRRAGGQGY